MRFLCLLWQVLMLSIRLLTILMASRSRPRCSFIRRLRRWRRLRNRAAQGIICVDLRASADHVFILLAPKAILSVGPSGDSSVLRLPRVPLRSTRPYASSPPTGGLCWRGRVAWLGFRFTSSCAVALYRGLLCARVFSYFLSDHLLSAAVLVNLRSDGRPSIGQAGVGYKVVQPYKGNAG